MLSTILSRKQMAHSEGVIEWRGEGWVKGLFTKEQRWLEKQTPDGPQWRARNRGRAGCALTSPWPEGPGESCRYQSQKRAIWRKLEQRKALMLAWVWRGGSPGRPLSLVTLRNSVASPVSTPTSPHGQTPRAESRMTRAEGWFRGQAENILHPWKIRKTRPLQKKIQQTFFQCKPGICPITSSSPSPLLLTCSSLLVVRETRATVSSGWGNISRRILRRF